MDLETETYETATTYDALNRPVTLITPDDGEIKYTYDKGGLLKTVEVENVHSLDTDIVNNIECNAKGQRTKIQYENDTTTTYQYDEFTFRVIRIRITRHSDSKELQDLRYWYDPIGNITLQKDDAQQTVYFDGSVAEPHNDYTYDALYRLIKVKGREHAGNNDAPNHSDSSRMGIAPVPIDSADTAKMRRYKQCYEYDAVGNFIEMKHTVTGGTGNWTRHYITANNSNRLQSTVVGVGTPESYTYDNRGNITGGFTHLQSLEYNAENRLEKVVIDGNRTAYYQYDSNGQRVRKTIVNTSANKTEMRKYVGEWEVYRKFDSISLTIEVERETLHISDDTGRVVLIDTLLDALGEPDEQLLRYQYSNHLQSATLELDDAGAIISYEEYYPYGSTSFQSGRSGTEVSLKRYRYTGKERDEESGLYYHGARYFIPWLARWTSTEPLNSLWYNSQNIDYENVNSYQDLNNTLQAKYPTLSPYNYCANNPILFVDPNGREIWISYYNYVEGKKRQEQDKPIFVKYENGRLTNPDGTDYTGDNEYILMVKGVIDDVRATDDRFERVISFMENDNFKGESVKHYISNVVQRLEGPHFKEPYDYRSSLMGNGSQVQETNVRMFKGDGFSDDFINAYNASLTIKFVPDIDMNRGSEIASEFTKETIFTHELKHLFNKRFNRVIPTKYGNATGLRYEERDAMHFENIYRHAKGLNVRTKYSLLKDGTYSEFLQEDYINLSDYKLDTKPIDLSNMSLIPKGKGTWD